MYKLVPQNYYDAVVKYDKRTQERWVEVERDGKTVKLQDVKSANAIAANTPTSVPTPKRKRGRPTRKAKAFSEINNQG